MMRADAYEEFSEAIIKSKTMKRLIIQNCNLHEKDNLRLLSKGIQRSHSLEYVDFQLCNLSDKHVLPIRSIVKEQFEFKENLNWKLGLRAQQKVFVH